MNVIEDGAILGTVREVISVCCKHGVFKLLDDKPGASAQEIARCLGYAPRQVAAGIEVLIGAGVIDVHGDGYALTPQSRVYLLEDSPLFDHTLPRVPMSNRMRSVLQSGAVGGSVASWAKGKATAPGVWAAEMHKISFPLGFALGETDVFRSALKIMDVAGGAGSVCIALALKNPNLQATVLELPKSVPTAERMIARYGLSNRIRCVGANMFSDEWPGGFDAVLFTNIFHDWGDDKCQLLAKKAFASLVPGGVVALQERLFNEEGPGPLATAVASLSMAMLMEGRQFRGRELTAMLEAAGFVRAGIRPLLGPYSTVLATKPA